MEVREIESIGEFEALRGDWDAAFAADAHASPFMSWPWLRGWFDVTPHPWSVLAAREDSRSPWRAFLPISVRGSRSALRIDHLREIHMAGEPTADYNGMVIDPAIEDRALAAFARALADDLPWEVLRFEQVNDARVSKLLARLPDSAEVVEKPGAACPRMPLPDSFDAYIASLSRATRQSLRKRIRRAEREFTLTRFDGRTDEAQIDALIHMAIHRTREHPDPNTWRLHSMLRCCAAAGLGHMVMLWKDQTPVAGVAGLINRATGSFGLWVTSFDERFSEFSPGRVAVALSIRDAIDMRLREFDFMRGEEPYKFQFGAVSAHNRTIIVNKPTLQGAVRRGITSVRESLRL